MSIRPWRDSVSLDHPGDVGFGRDVGADSAVGWAQIGDDNRRVLRLEPARDRGADPLRTAGDDGDLAVEGAHQRSGEYEVGTMIRFRCVWMSGKIFGRNSFQRSSAASRALRSSRSAKSS